MLKVTNLLINYLENPIGIEENPQFSWCLETNKRATVQVAYQIQIATDQEFLTLIYDSGMVKTNRASQIVLTDLKLEPLHYYYVRVRVTDNNQEVSLYSDVRVFLTAKLSLPWSAQFITAESNLDADKSAGSYLRKELSITKKVKAAFVCSSALGLYKLYFNGKKISSDQFAPGWTSYHKHLRYQVYDVTKSLQMNENIIAVHLGAGWYKGLMGFLGRRNNYGQQTAFIGEIYITYEDGTKEVIESDLTWQGHDSPVIFSEIYDGEIYDARKEVENWNQPGKIDKNWRPVQVLARDKSILVSQEGARVKIIDTLPVKEIITTPLGETVLDFGQNLTGFLEFKAKGKAGEKVVYQCFEVLDAKGNVYTANLRSAKERVEYTFKDNELVSFYPNFTFQGFRYVQIIEYPETVKADNFIAHTVHSEMKTTGSFQCSNENLNQLWHNIVWSLKGNFLDIPTDCPQRNERVGWTGDAQIFCRTASYIMDTYTFFTKWLKDVAADQTNEGGVPHIVPDLISGYEKDDWLLSQGTHSAAAWADVAVIMPWTLYLTYGDKKVLIEQYESMKKWISFMETHAKDYIWNYKLQFGDWVALDAKEGSYFGATPNDLTCTAYFAYSTGLMEKISGILNKEEDRQYFGNLYQNIVSKYQKTFFTSKGRLKAQTQTAQIISLYFDLVPKEYKPNVIADLLNLLEKEEGHLVTGFVGTPYFCHALSENGCLEAAYNLLLKEDFPSWLYQVKMGATTIWEHWDGIKPDGSMWSPDMNSFNHYAYGAIGEWMYRVILGIEIDGANPGYKNIILKPQLGGNITYAKGAYKSIHGNIESYWERKEKTVIYRFTIPANTTATIKLSQALKLLEMDGIDFKENKEGYIGQVGSGKYQVKFIMK
ncbi:MAG TPA: glycoside hydrolase family 78 protein [Candidatus Dorea intestinavium]|nr:glycoside hydrolase family 78 protein [Candidatus Dorea intestinavium]